MRTASGRFGELNVHRADCDRKHANPCDPWPVRLPRMLDFLNTEMRCSAYAFIECLPEQRRDLTIGLGWATEKNPSAWGDENFNAVAIDRSKFTDIEAHEISLLGKPGDEGDDHRRSVNWLTVVHLDSGIVMQFGASHLETGDPDERELQGARLAAAWPKGGLAALGVDRNSWTSSSAGPRGRLRAAGVTELEVDSDERSFNGFGTPQTDGNRIDGIHYTGFTLRGPGELHSTAGGLQITDHSGLVLPWQASVK